MPRVSDAHRQARRDEIAQAAMRCLRRQGFSGTTMADIIAESGLSAGAIYVNFENKAALVRHTASRVVTGRARSIERLVAEPGPPPSPTQVVELVLSELVADDAPFGVIVQFWGESAVDPELRVTVRSVIDGLEGVFAGAMVPWVTEHRPDDDPEAEARRLASVMVTLCHGFIVHMTVTGTLDPAGYVDGLRALLPD